MSDSTHTASHTSGSHAGQVVTGQEFDAREVELFGQKDTQAIKAIGKMLVAFFFYSLIVMVAVGYWTMRVSQKPAAVDHAAGDQAAQATEHHDKNGSGSHGHGTAGHGAPASWDE